MVADQQDARPWVPKRPTLRRLEGAVDECRGCELWQDATQAVLSSGSADARLMLVGEQPGDQEDKEGEPFVGPAGNVLASALEAAGIGSDEDGRLTPLHGAIVPPTSTRQRSRVPSLPTARAWMRPSSISTSSPGATTWARSAGKLTPSSPV